MRPADRKQPLLNFLDRFLSVELRSAPAAELRRARALVGGSLFVQILMAIITVDLLMRGFSSAWHTALGVLVWGSVLPLLRLGRTRLAGIWISCYAQLSMLFVVLHRDSTFMVFDPWQGVQIMAALYFVGMGFGIVSVGIVIAEMIAIPMLADHGWLLETPFLLDRGSGAINSGAAFVALFILGWLYTSARDTANQALTETLHRLTESREQYQLIAEGTDAVPFRYDLKERVFEYAGPHAERVFGWPLDAWVKSGFVDDLFTSSESSRLRNMLSKVTPGEHLQFECSARSERGRQLALRFIATLHVEFGTRTLTGLMLDITEVRRLEGELRQAQKLESVGRLASGIAHEINTPVQFVSNSVDFLRDASGDLLGLLGKLQSILQSTLTGTSPADAARNAAAAAEDADLPYLAEQVPAAVSRAADGLQRVTAIVRSMKEFGHPDGKEKTAIDLNRAIASTLTVAQHEYRQAADVQTSYGDLPPVTCFPGEINQALLNIIVNASHALDDVMKASGKRGVISVSTKRENGDVLVSIADTGGGIPASIRDRIFDPFFTTKSVGRGTGQGLSVTRTVIVEKHRGELWFESEAGKGTTFFIRLPIWPDLELAAA